MEEPPPSHGENRPSLWRRVKRNYVLKRFIHSLVTIFLVITGVFFLLRAMPKGPIDTMAATLIAQGTPSDRAYNIARARVNFDPDQPLLVQYWDYLTSVFKGDFGTTLTGTPEPVLDRIMEYLPWTLFSVGVGVTVAIVAGLFIGMILAYKRNGIVDQIVTPIAGIMAAVPNYLFLAIIILVGSVSLGLFDYASMQGRLSLYVEPGFNLTFFGDALYHAMLPIIAYAITVAGGWILTMKSTTAEVMGEEYVTVARARGLKEGRIRTMYVGRNALLPVVPQIALALGTVVGGAIVVEQLMQYRGSGQMFYEAIRSKDYPVVQGFTIFLTASVVFANFLVDVLNSRLDPRIRLGDKESK